MGDGGQLQTKPCHDSNRAAYEGDGGGEGGWRESDSAEE